MRSTVGIIGAKYTHSQQAFHFKTHTPISFNHFSVTVLAQIYVNNNKCKLSLCHEIYQCRKKNPLSLYFL